MPAFRPVDFYGDESSDRSIMSLIMQSGQRAGEHARRSGDIWGSAIGNIGQTLTAGLGAYMQDQQQRQQTERMARRDAAWVSFVEGGEWQSDPRAALSGSLRIWGPEQGVKMAEGLNAFRELGKKGDEAEVKRLATVLQASESFSDPIMERWYPQMRQQAAPVLQQLGIDPSALPETWTPELRQEMRGLGMALRGERPNAGEGFTLSPGQQRFGPDGRPIAQVAPAPRVPEPATVGSFEDYVVRSYGQNPTPAQITEARKVYQQADDRPTVNINTPRPLSQTAEAAIIQRLTKSWDTASAPVREINRQVGIMDAGLTAARRGDINAGSQAVIQTFNKILDSLSVVREGEYARTAEGQSAMNRVRGAIERLSSGGAGVPLSELEKFATLARDMAERQKAFLPAMRARTAAQAARYNIPEELIFADEGMPPVPPPAAGGVPPAGGAPPALPPSGGQPRQVSSRADYDSLPSGAQYLDPNGVLRTKP